MVKPSHSAAAAVRLHLPPRPPLRRAPLPHVRHSLKLPIWIQLLHRTPKVTPALRVLLRSIKTLRPARPPRLAPVQPRRTTNVGPQHAHDGLEVCVFPPFCGIADVVFDVYVEDRLPLCRGQIGTLGCSRAARTPCDGGGSSSSSTAEMLGWGCEQEQLAGPWLKTLQVNRLTQQQPSEAKGRPTF